LKRALRCAFANTGKPLADFQHTQFKLSDMATRLHASRLMVRHAARALDAGDPLKTQVCALFSKPKLIYMVFDC
jgi:alkylation response protein AidB-like acyl-CoA dehydrogenase